MNDPDTIAAIATPPGQGGIGIIRLSGKKASSIAGEIFGHCPEPRLAEYGAFVDEDGSVIDKGIALFFNSPESFTGEDVFELHGHGGPIILDCLMQRVLLLGARAARAGEFSERAFLNNKLDLTQAEAIADLIAADSLDAAKAAVRSLQGEFSQQIKSLVEEVIQLRMYVESALDFPEEEIDYLADSHIRKQLELCGGHLQAIKLSSRRGRLLKEGMTVVIAGKPNAGKSSLLNQLSGHESAIVTELPGTTRDVLREHIEIDGLPLHIVDTAGLRKSRNVIEKEGVKRAKNAFEQADQILHVIDIEIENDEDDSNEFFPDDAGITKIYNKIDVLNKKAELINKDGTASIYLSAKTGDGIDILRQHLKHIVGYEQGAESQFIARRRHLEAIDKADFHMSRAVKILQESKAGELVAEELKCVQHELAKITGAFSSDDLLGRIFSEFCIGK